MSYIKGNDMSEDLFKRLYPARAPEGARIKLKDGTFLPVEVAYDGIVINDGERIHQWRATSTVPLTMLDSLDFDMFPAKSSVVIDGPVNPETVPCEGCENGVVVRIINGNEVRVPHNACKGAGQVPVN